MSQPEKKEIKGLSKRNIYLGVAIGMAVSIVLIYSTFDLQSFREIQWDGRLLLFIGVVMILMSLRHLMYMYRLWLVTDKRLRFRQLFESIVLWEFASVATPGIVGGAAVAMFIINKEKVNMGKSTASVMAVTFMDNVFFIVSSIVLFLIVGLHEMFALGESCASEMDLPILNVFGNVQYIFLVGISISLIITFLLAYGLLMNPHGLKKILVGFTSFKLFSKWRARAIQTGDDIITTSHEYRGKKAWFWIKLFLATAVGWSCKYLVANSLISAFGELSGFDHITVMSRMVTLWLIMLIPLTPGASGLAELTFLALMCSYIDNGLVGAITILWRTFTYYPYLVLGIIVMPRWINRVFSNN